ncbi:TM1812 family CRISPR-associated protein [Succinimonas amylolytica]|uniref:TM1812 family CRISPR-associated protein n=1 Tax=Succinimonas amylolytica TaxID=83769 RepID=UPI00038221BE|nr:TM1812 family CRISPR-associated protein [Succinimonas amylolytica]
MNSSPLSAMLISFLGKGEYWPASYSYPDCEPITCRYGAVAFMAYLKEHKNVTINRLVICGTDSSSWTLLPSYLEDLAARIFGTDQDPAAVMEGLRKVSRGASARELARLASASRGADFGAEFSEALKAFENDLSQVLQPAGLVPILIRHAEDFSTYDRQTDLLHAIQDAGLVTGDTRIYLDITYGLRIMSFMIFTSFQSLCYTSGIKISGICYSPEYMPRSEPAERLSFIEGIKNRLRFLKRTAPDLFQKKKHEVVEILNSLKQPQTSRSQGNAPSGPSQPRPSRVCFLDSIAGLLQDAAAVNRFRVSLDPLEFEPQLRGNGTSGRNDCWTPEEARKLREISYRLNVCDYDAAGPLQALKERIKSGAGRKEVSEILDQTFSWTDSYFGSREPAVRSRALKKLAARYLDAGDYLHAVNSCYRAINEIEFAGQTGGGEQELRGLIRRRYGSDFENVFIKQLRAMVVHLNDKTEVLDDSKAFIHRMIAVDNDNIIDAAELRNYFRKCFAALGVDCAPQPESRGHVLFSFIGAGDYGHASYRYRDPFRPDAHDFDLENSGAIGVSLAARMCGLSCKGSSGSAEKASGLTRFVILGTQTSNWRVILESLDQEFIRKHSLSENVSGGGSGAAGESSIAAAFQALKQEVTENLGREDNVRGVLPEECLKKLNAFFKTARDSLGLEIVLAATDDSIANPEVQNSIVGVIAANVRNGDRVSLDITHCYRIVPILSICALLYLTAVRQIVVEHIFYGDVPMETEFKELNGLKKAQLPDEESFSRAAAEITAVLGDVSGTENLSGSVYDMRNLHRLVEYAAAINQYHASGNLEFLRPLIETEFCKKDFASYVDFINGVILDNISMFRASAEFLNPVVARLEQGIGDPLLRTLKDDMLRGLQWVKELSDDNTDFGIRLLLQKSSTALENRNYIFCYITCYEAMQKISKRERQFIEMYCNKGRIRISEHRFIADADLPQEQKDIISRINQGLDKKEQKAADDGTAVVLQAEDFIAGQKKSQGKDRSKVSGNNLEGRILTMIGCSIFEGREWNLVRNLRNYCFHSSCQVSAAITADLKNQRKLLGRIIRRIDSMLYDEDGK